MSGQVSTPPVVPVRHWAFDDDRRAQAPALLSNPEVAVSLAATETGFCSHEACSQAFRQWTGLSPHPVAPGGEALMEVVDVAYDARTRRGTPRSGEVGT